MLEGLCTNSFSGLRRGLERDFTFFANSAAGTPGRDPRERDPESYAAEIDALETRFLSSFITLLDAGHYKLLSSAEWDAAQAEDFLLTLPVAVNWDAMDPGVLPRAVWASRPGDRVGLPPALADRMLIFHRGVDVAHIQGTYILRKIDLILTFYILQPLFKVIAFLASLVGVKHLGGAPNYIDTAEASEAAVTDADAAAAAKVAAKAIAEGGLHAASINVERRTFARTFPTGASVFKQLFKRVDLQEACFKDVIILYRKSVPDGAAKPGEFDIQRPADPAFLRRNLIVKRFASIPIADLELVFPDKKVYMPPQVLLNMIIALVGIVTMVVTTLKGGLAWKVVWPMLTALGSRAAQIYTTANVQRTTIQRAMQKLIYDRTMASQEAVLSSLTEEMARQRTRELMVAYGVLAAAPMPLTPGELDDRCEVFLEQQFGLVVDFTTEDALPTLLEWGLAELAPGVAAGAPAVKVVALPLGAALAKLDAAWDSLYDFSGAAAPPMVLGKVLSTVKDAAVAVAAAPAASASSSGATPKSESKKKSFFSRLSKG